LEPASGLRAAIIDTEGWCRGIVYLALTEGADGPWFDVMRLDQFTTLPVAPSDRTAEAVAPWQEMETEVERHRPLDQLVPLEWVQAEANTKRMLGLFLGLAAQPLEDAKMLLPMARARGKKPDAFYKRLVTWVTYCTDHGIAFGPRIAADNDVALSTVHAWVREARRRGLLGEASR
jgi:hypothetical protein